MAKNSKASSLFDLVSDPRHMRRAIRQCQRRESSGWSGLARTGELAEQLAAQLSSGSWSPETSKRQKRQSYIGEELALVRPTATDRVVLRAARNAIEHAAIHHLDLRRTFGHLAKKTRIDALRYVHQNHFPYRTFVSRLELPVSAESINAGNFLRTFIADGSLLNLLDTIDENFGLMTAGVSTAPLLRSLLLPEVLVGTSMTVRYSTQVLVFGTDSLDANAALEVGLLQMRGARMTDARTATIESLFLWR